MTLANVIATIPAIDTINVQDSNGSLYESSNQNLRATYENVNDILDKEVTLLRPFRDVLIIGIE